MRYLDALNGIYDGTPYFLRDFTLGMDVINVKTTDVFTDSFNPYLSSNCICAFQRFTGQDAVIGCTHSPAFIIEQFGGEMQYPEYKVPIPVSHPFSKITDFKNIEVQFKGKILNAFKSYSLVKEKMKGTADVVGNITGPLTKASVLASLERVSMLMESDESVLKDLLDFCNEFTEIVIEKLSNNVDSFIIAAAVDNPDIFGFNNYEKFSSKRVSSACQFIKNNGLPVVYHPHGVFISKNIDRSKSIMNMSIDGFHFAEGNDISMIADKFKGRMCVLGGIDIIPKLYADARSVISETNRYLNIFRNNNYVFMASCSLHRGVPLENINIMCKTLKNYRKSNS
ncbi:MAG: hypothetical protein MJY64_00895 [archaeon]|nr:hypothetical protein [archaeon]